MRTPIHPSRAARRDPSRGPRRVTGGTPTRRRGRLVAPRHPRARRLGAGRSARRGRTALERGSHEPRQPSRARHPRPRESPRRGGLPAPAHARRRRPRVAPLTMSVLPRRRQSASRGSRTDHRVGAASARTNRCPSMFSCSICSSDLPAFDGAKKRRAPRSGHESRVRIHVDHLRRAHPLAPGHRVMFVRLDWSNSPTIRGHAMAVLSLTTSPARLLLHHFYRLDRDWRRPGHQPRSSDMLRALILAWRRDCPGSALPPGALSCS